MQHFISVLMTDRKLKKVVLEKILQSVNMPLNEKTTNYGIFEGKDKNIVLKVELPKQLTEKQSDIAANKLSTQLFELGYNDFDIEISTDIVSNDLTLENTDWHTNEAPVQHVQLGTQGSGEFSTSNIDTSLPYVEIEMNGKQKRVYGEPNRLPGFLQKITSSGGKVITPITGGSGVKTGPVDKPKIPSVGGQNEPGSKEALMAIVTQYAKPGMTLADVDAMEKAAISSEVPSAGDDANFLSQFKQGFMRFAKNKSWRVSFVLANAAEQQDLPGLFNSKEYFVFMDEASDDGDGNQSVGGPTTAAGASLKQYMLLAKRGLVPKKKILKIQKSFANQPDNMKIVDAIVAAQNAATSQVKTGPVDGPTLGDSPNSATDDEVSDTPTNKFSKLSQKEVDELVYNKMKRLAELLAANPEPTGTSIEETKKVLYKKLYNNYMFEDASADKEISEIISDLKLLMPRMNQRNQQIIKKIITKADPYVKRNASAKPTRLGTPGNPLADFAKSGKGGLANDPDEKLAIDELQKYLGIPVDGKYGPSTKDAVRKYQEKNGLKVDGDAGPATIKHMLGNPGYKADPVDPNTGGNVDPNTGGDEVKPKSDADQRKADAKKDPENGVAPVDEQLLETAIKFGWKKKSYYVSVTKVKKSEENNNIEWVFYKDDQLKQGQLVATLGNYWIKQLEAELKRRADAGSDNAKKALEIIDPPGEETGTKGPVTPGPTDPKVDDGIVEDIYDAVKGAGTDDDELFAAIRAIRDNAHYKVIARMFKKKYPDAIDSDYPTLAIWMRDDLEGWIWDGDNVKQFDREMNRLGVKINKPIPPEKVAKGEEVISGGETVIGTGRGQAMIDKVGGGRGKKVEKPGERQAYLDKKKKEKEEVVTPKPKKEKPEEKPEEEPEEKPYTDKQNRQFANLAKRFWEAGKFGMTTGATDEEEFAAILKQIRDARDYKELDKVFKDYKENDDGISLEAFAKSEMKRRDQKKYFYDVLKGKNIPLEGL